ncbi:MAG: C39 family peptidase [Lachnospiraceae bacterium]|nr:C39 family peptidase [Lachnospiraceae bacterium]
MTRKKMLKLLSIIIALLVMPLQSVAATPPYSNSLSVSRSQQEKSNWCWAACAKMVGNYMGYSRSQTNIVNYVKGSSADVGASASEVCSALAYATNNTYYSSTIVPPSMSSIKSQIDSAVPIVVRMDWTSGGSHNVVVKGYTDATKLIIVDPEVGCSGIMSYEYSDLQTGTWISSGHGRCTNFYWLIHR